MRGFLPERISFALPINYARSLSKQASFSSDVPPSKSQTKLEPKAMFTWEEAKQFCARLTRLLRAAMDEGGKEWPKEVAKHWIVRRPTDAEWSLAVGLEEERGGTPKEKDLEIKGVYPWGTQWPPPSGAGNYGDLTCQQKYPGMPNIEGYVDGYAETAPVGSFKPNRYDLYDLGGNVWEWCEDWLDKEQKQRVVRGASWRNGPPEGVLSSHRGSNVPNGRFQNIGFRVVLGAAP